MDILDKKWDEKQSVFTLKWGHWDWIGITHHYEQGLPMLMKQYCNLPWLQLFLLVLSIFTQPAFIPQFTLISILPVFELLGKVFVGSRTEIFQSFTSSHWIETIFLLCWEFRLIACGILLTQLQQFISTKATAFKQFTSSTFLIKDKIREKDKRKMVHILFNRQKLFWHISQGCLICTALTLLHFFPFFFSLFPFNHFYVN